MTSLEAALRQIHSDLTEANVYFALVGGLAVSARTEPRFTRDADLAVAVATDAEAEALIHSLRSRDYGIEAIVEQEAVGRLATVRLARSSNVLSRDDVTRPQDLVDLRALLRVASSVELGRAHESLALIASRGYHRGRELMSELNTLRSLSP